MELRAYWSIIWRRIWIVALVFGVVALYVGYQYYHLLKIPGALTAYSSNITIQVGIQPGPDGSTNSSADNTLISENLADTLATGPILDSKEFDSRVIQQIAADRSLITARFGAGADLGDWQNPATVGGALSAVRSHNLVTISASWSTSAGAWAITNAIGEVSTTHLCQFLSYGYVIAHQNTCSAAANSAQPAVAAQVISSASNPAAIPGTSVNKRTLLFVLLLVALIVGLALAFLVDYLDDRIYSKEDAANLLQLPVYGEVPRAPAAGRTRTKSISE